MNAAFSSILVSSLRFTTRRNFYLNLSLHTFLSSLLYPFLLSFSLPVNSLSSPIFIMFLGGNFFQCCNKYNKCSEDFFDQSSLHHKYFIQNKLEL